MTDPTSDQAPDATPGGAQPHRGASVRRLPGRLELHAPADPEILDLVHALLEHLFSHHPGIADQDRMRFEMAVIEVLGNIVEHAYAHDTALAVKDPEAERRFDICLGVDETALMATLSDNGRPTALDLGSVAMPDEMAESGRGIALAVAALDSLDYERVEGRNHWWLSLQRT